MTRAVRRLFVCAFLVLAAAALGAPAIFAQGGATSSLSGTVTDTSGAVVPGASVTVKNMATNVASEAVTNAEGQFTVPALQRRATTRVMVTLSGFKTATVNDVEVNAGVPAGVSVKMEVGGVEEQVVVTGGSEIVADPVVHGRDHDLVEADSEPAAHQPQRARLRRQPAGREHAGHGAQLDGQRPAAGLDQHDPRRREHPGQLPEDLRRVLRARPAAPRRDRGSDRDLGRQRRRQRRPGGRQHPLRHQVGHQHLQGQHLPHLPERRAQHEHVLQQPQPRGGSGDRQGAEGGSPDQYQPGFNAGGPISIPGLFDGHDKAFFFFNYEDSRSPSKITRTRTILTDGAAQGLYAYSTSCGTQTVNLLQLAAANGQTSTLDPTISKLLGDIRTASGQGQIVASVGSAACSRRASRSAATTSRRIRLGRVDYNISKHHTLTGSFNYNHVNSTPDTTNSREPFFPGFPNTGSQQSTRYTTSETLRSMFGIEHRQRVPRRRVGRRDPLLAGAGAVAVRRHLGRRSGGLLPESRQRLLRDRAHQRRRQRRLLRARRRDPALRRHAEPGSRASTA